MRAFFARIDPCEAILVLGGFKIHGHGILLDGFGNQFDGVPPLAFAFCGERNPFHTEVGLHLLVTLNVLQFFDSDQYRHKFLLDAVQ